jgi:hypothetical protein
MIPCAMVTTCVSRSLKLSSSVTMLPPSSDEGEFLIISESAEIGGDFRHGSIITGDAGSETSWITPGREDSCDSSRAWSTRSPKYDPLSGRDAFIADEAICREGERLRMEIASDKAYDASSAVSSLTP